MKFQSLTIASLIDDLSEEKIDQLIKGILSPLHIMLSHDGGILVILLLNI